MTAVTESPLPPHSRELKTNKPAAIAGEGERMCVLLWELSGVFILLLRMGRRSCFEFPVMAFLSDGAAPVNSPRDLGLRISLYFYSQNYSKYNSKMLLYWIRLHCFGVSLLHAWAHAHALDYPHYLGDVDNPRRPVLVSSRATQLRWLRLCTTAAQIQFLSSLTRGGALFHVSCAHLSRMVSTPVK